jgi:hypothetical protein
VQDPFASGAAGCHPAVKALPEFNIARHWDARHKPVPIEHINNSDSQEAVRAAFTAAVHLLKKSDGQKEGKQKK